MWTFEKAYAKINLALDCLYRRDDGYHELRMLMQSVELFDDLMIEITDSGLSSLELQGGSPEIPLDSTNLALKAAEMFYSRTNLLNTGLHIRLKKRIPAGAGLAGGSSDAAAVLRGLNRLFGYPLTKLDLMRVGAEVGSDVPFCIEGGLSLAEGRGEKLRKLDCGYDCWIVLAKPSFSVSTSSVFAKFEQSKVTTHPDITRGITLLEQGKIDAFGSTAGNVLESVTLADYPELYALKQIMVEQGAAWAMMSGSGPTVFGIFESLRKACSCFRDLDTEEKFIVKPYFGFNIGSE